MNEPDPPRPDSSPDDRPPLLRLPAWLCWALALTLILLAFCKAMRFPGLWPITHYCFNYEVGFQKRGLVGTVLGLFSDTWDYWVLTAVAVTVLGAVVALLALVQGRRDLSLAGLILFSSPGFVFLFHTVAYLDHFMLVAVLGLTLLRGRWPAALYWPVYFVAFTVLLFVHEGSGVIVGPLFCLLIHVGRESWRDKVLLSLGLLVAFVGLLLFLRSAGQVPNEQARQLRLAVREDASFTPSNQAFRLLSRDLQTNLDFMAGYPLREPLLRSLRSYGPATLLFLLGGILAALKAGVPGRQRLLLAALVLVASFSPLLLNIVGSDTYRWSSLTTITSFLALAMLVRSVGAPWRTTPAALVVTALLVIVNVAAPNHFFDQLRPRRISEYPQVLELVTSFGDPEAIPRQ